MRDGKSSHIRSTLEQVSEERYWYPFGPQTPRRHHHWVSSFFNKLLLIFLAGPRLELSKSLDTDNDGVIQTAHFGKAESTGDDGKKLIDDHNLFVHDTLPPVISLGGYIPGNNYGDDVGFDEF